MSSFTRRAAFVAVFALAGARGRRPGNGCGALHEPYRGLGASDRGARSTRRRMTAPPSARSRGAPPLFCRNCPLWYGDEDAGWGPCSIKHRRGDERYLTIGSHPCDEGYTPPTVRGKAARFKGSRSTSSASAVGYSSTTKAGALSRPAHLRNRAG